MSASQAGSPRDRRRSGRGSALMLLFESFSLGRRLAGVYALIVGLLLTVLAVVLVHVAGMRKDADRFLEETRERIVMSRIVDEVDRLSAILDMDPSARPVGVELMQEEKILEQTLDDLIEFFQAEDDPSRPRHQFEERRIAESVLADLRILQGILVEEAGQEPSQEILNAIEHARRFAAVLDEEAREEAERADKDLEARAGATVTVLFWVIGIVIAILCATVFLVYRTVVQPLGVLREGAERFGSGDLSYRVHVRSRDEIGVLASSMNQMASRLAEAQAALQTKVEERTREFVRAARLADLGVFAAGVAHEINTPLASILSSAEGLERRVDRGDADEATQREYLGTICGEAHRARDITSRLLALSRHDQDATGPVDVDFVFDQVRSLTSHALRKRSLTLVTSIQKPGLTLEGSAGELVQILVNLVVNARDASPQGGQIQISARDAMDRVVIEVQDHGAGIAPEDLDRIFDPFFTTKPPGEGTGLGLALVAALASSRGALVHVESEPNVGTTFTIDLPKQWRKHA